MQRRISLSQFLEQFGKGLVGIHPTGLGPIDELRDIYPPVGCFAVIDPGLGFSQFLAYLPLGQTCLLPHFPQENGE